jgi:hypothetical protein
MPPNIIGVLAQADRERKQNFQGGLRDIASRFDRMRLKEMGKEFLRYGDSSPEGLKRFAEEKGLGLDEMQALVQVVRKFREYQKESMPTTSTQKYMDQSGNIHEVIWNEESQKPIRSSVTNRSKLTLKDQTLEDGSTRLVGVNPFNLSARAVAGGALKTGRSAEEELRDKVKIARAGVPSQPNQVSKEAAKVRGKGVGERLNKRQQNAEEGINQNFRLSMVENAITKGADTGFGAETMLNLKSIAQTLGIPNIDTSGQELIRKVSNEMALRLRNPESGLGLTGNTSNKDLQFLKDSVVGLGRTEQGNLKIIDAMRKLNQFKVDLYKEQERIINDNNGQIPADIDKRLVQFANSYQMFTPEEKAEIANLTGQGPLGGSQSQGVGTPVTADDYLRSIGLGGNE